MVVEAVASDGAAVLNADDPLVAEMAAASDGKVVYFSVQADNHIIAAHLAADGRAVLLADGAIVLADSTTRIPLVELGRLHWTVGGAVGFQVQNALAATAAAWAAGLNPALIARALATFTTDVTMVPGRFNRTELKGVEVVLDYGHNRAALEAIGAAVNALEPRRTVLMITLPGDRRDEDLFATMDTTLQFADAYVIYDTVERRGREKGVIPQLLGTRVPTGLPWVSAANQREGLALAWQQVQPGDRLVIIADIVEDAIGHLQTLAASVAEEDAACGLPLADERAVGA